MTMHENPQRFRWAVVTLGAVVALSVGLTGGVIGGAAGLLVGELNPWQGVTSIALSIIVPALALASMWLIARRRAPFFGKGVLIGGCVAVLVSGLCGAILNLT